MKPLADNPDIDRQILTHKKERNLEGLSCLELSREAVLWSTQPASRSSTTPSAAELVCVQRVFSFHGPNTMNEFMRLRGVVGPGRKRQTDVAQNRMSADDRRGRRRVGWRFLGVSVVWLDDARSRAHTHRATNVFSFSFSVVAHCVCVVQARHSFGARASQ